MLFFCLAVLLLPVIVVVYLAYWLLIHVAVWKIWCGKGKFILFVYSDSPNWKQHVEEQVLPRIQGHAVILNWSERRKWQKHFSLPVMAFRLFGRYREFNPLAVVFRPFRFSKKFRFWKPFKDFKHGKVEPLERMEKDFFALVDSIIAKKAA